MRSLACARAKDVSLVISLFHLNCLPSFVLLGRLVARPASGLTSVFAQPGLSPRGLGTASACADAYRWIAAAVDGQGDAQ